MPYKLSPSTLKLYLNCPRCFYLSLKERIWRPREHFSAFSFGSSIDAVVKEWFDGFRANNDSPPEIKREGLELFKDMKKIEEWREWRDPKKGIKWYDLQGNSFFGAIDDLLVNPDGALTVLDYKTKRSPIKEDPVKKYPEYKFQLESYAFIFKQMGYDATNHGYLLFFIPKKVQESGMIAFENVLWKVALDTETPKKVFKEAISILEAEYEPKPSKNCEYCRREEMLSKRNKNK